MSSDSDEKIKLQCVNRKCVCHVKLEKDGKHSLGISFKGSARNGEKPTVKKVKANSLAWRSLSIGEGDTVLSINGQDTSGMNSKEAKRQLKQLDSGIELDLEYRISQTGGEDVGVFRPRTMSVVLRKEGHSFGFLLRKNVRKHLSLEYPIISDVKPGGPADRYNIFPGDRLLQVDEISFSWCPHNRVAEILQEKKEALFIVEYNVADVEFSADKGRRIELEIDCPGSDLGIALAPDYKETKCIRISDIHQGSVAERSGLFQVGDEVQRVNGINLKDLACSKVNPVLSRFKKEPWSLVFITSKCLSVKNESGVKSKDKNAFQKKSLPLPIAHNTNNISDSNIENDYPEEENSEHSFTVHRNVWDSREIPSTTTEGSNATTSMISSSNYNSKHILKDLSMLEKHISYNTCSSNGEETLKLKTSTKSIVQRSIVPPPNSPTTTYNSTNESDLLQFDDKEPSMTNFHLDLVLTFRHLVRNISDMENFISKVETRNGGAKDANISVVKDGFYAVDMQNLAFICSQTKQSIQLMIKQFVQTAKKQTPALKVGKKHQDFVFRMETLKFLMQSDCNLLVVRKIISNDLFVSLRKRLHEVDLDCVDCKKTCLQTMYAIQKLLLTERLNVKNEESRIIVENLTDTIKDFVTSCEECKRPWCSISDVVETANGDGCDLKSCSKLNKLRCSSMKEHDAATAPSVQDMLNHKTQNSASSEIGMNVHEEKVSFRPKPEGMKSNFKENFQTRHFTESQKDYVESKRNTRQLESHEVNNYASSFQKQFQNSKNLQSIPEQSWKSAEVVSIMADAATSIRPKRLPVKHKSLPQFLHPTIDGSNSNSYRFSAKNQPDNEAMQSKSDYAESVLTSSQRYQVKEFNNSNKFTLSITDLKLKNEGKGFGLSLGFADCRSSIGTPIVLDIKPRSAAEKSELLMVGDEMLSINSRNTVDISLGDLKVLKAEAFVGEELLLKVQFKVTVPEVKTGTFQVCLETNKKPGIVLERAEQFSPFIVKGFVKGSVAHRSGELIPGDKILFSEYLQKESFDSLTGHHVRSKELKLTVRREEKESTADTVSSETRPISGTNFHIHRAQLHPLNESGSLFLDQEVTLFRDPVSWDFGFLVSRNQGSKKVYVSTIKSGGPADISKVIKKYDRILKVNGISVDNSEEDSVLKLLNQVKEKLTLVTRRDLQHH